MENFTTEALVLLGKGLCALLIFIVPIVLKKLEALVDGWIETAKTKAKAIEHARVSERLLGFMEIVDTAVHGTFAAAEKVKIEMVDGKPKITNLSAITAEIKDSVLKQATDSTGELMQKLGVDVEEVIKAKVQAKLGANS